MMPGMQNHTLSPLELKLLLHVYAIAEPLPQESSAQESAVIGFVDKKVIFRDATSGSGFSLTNRGRAWVTAILSVPMPTECYQIDGRIVPHD